ncbi:TIGR01777 family protein [Muricauda sp. JGD-17]|uniref:TIGR01777 family protein n=1 Tax=Flagellimonas ochracea TaxID=2696472 RepID=A0A964WVU5_9FLAO|nr:TIGR01777 family oxidoreductase [Allomuricauda ochracea]NAY90326.1 TIGR01777 family protein [Allomuricauda ochracea]
MKVLITGATGLVGEAIVKVLDQRNISVNYLTTSKEKITNSPDFQGFYWNPNNGEIDMACLEGVDAVINLAGASIAKRWTKEHKQKILESRTKSLDTLRNALATDKSARIKSFITASAIGIYPDSLTHYYDEKETAVDNSFVGDVVKQWEASADQFEDLGLDVAKIRIGIVLATDGGALPRMAAPVKNFVGAPVGSGEQWQSWVHIDDLAQMFVFVLENRLHGVFNGVSPNPVTNTKMTKELARVLNRPLWLPNVPKFVLKAVFGKMSYLLFASQRVSSKKIEKQGFIFLYPNLSLALEHLYVENNNKETSPTTMKNELV